MRKEVIVRFSGMRKEVIVRFSGLRKSTDLKNRPEGQHSSVGIDSEEAG